MKKIIVIMFFLIVLNLLFAEMNYKNQLFNLQNDYGTSRKKVAKELLDYKANDKLDNFCKYYLLSYCYFDLDYDEMKKVTENLNIAYGLVNELNEEEKLIAIRFVKTVEAVMTTIIKYSIFCYDDLYDVVDEIYAQHEIKGEINEVFKSFKYARFIKLSLRDFQENVMHDKQKDKYLKIIDKITKVQIDAPETLETNIWRD